MHTAPDITAYSPLIPAERVDIAVLDRLKDHYGDYPYEFAAVLIDEAIATKRPALVDSAVDILESSPIDTENSGRAATLIALAGVYEYRTVGATPPPAALRAARSNLDGVITAQCDLLNDHRGPNQDHLKVANKLRGYTGEINVLRMGIDNQLAGRTGLLYPSSPREENLLKPYRARYGRHIHDLHGVFHNGVRARLDIKTYVSRGWRLPKPSTSATRFDLIQRAEAAEQIYRRYRKLPGSSRSHTVQSLSRLGMPETLAVSSERIIYLALCQSLQVHVIRSLSQQSR